jgi:voltage-gated potassium channel
VVVGSGLVVATLEQSDPERNIQTIPDGLWWAVTTITTVGYGDRFPVTVVGRAVGAGVMILGIGLFGLLAASLASFLVEKDLDKEINPQRAAIEERLERIERLLQSLQQRATVDEGDDESRRPDPTPIGIVTSPKGGG